MRKSWIVCVQDAIEPGANRILMTEIRARLHRFILVLFLVHVMGAEVMLAALGCVCVRKTTTHLWILSLIIYAILCSFQFLCIL